ncbi:MAG TPA: hypothetical protein PK967_05525 [Candidatus Hydrogenedentes bacterium]|nr:hypothetical protein [Candidatus Hydrogenedentota bacterium]HRT65694.1 hypothetical protein [Candidatus Hydrogenedentota bacterium]
MARSLACPVMSNINPAIPKIHPTATLFVLVRVIVAVIEAGSYEHLRKTHPNNRKFIFFPPPNPG